MRHTKRSTSNIGRLGILPAPLVLQVVEFYTDRHRIVHSGPALRRLHSVATIDDYRGTRLWLKTYVRTGEATLSQLNQHFDRRG
jgi:hypothetical protein